MFWRGRRVFVTGHTGFKGSWLCLLLDRLGAQVTGYALAAPTVPSLFEEARVEEVVTHLHGDVRDRAALAEAMQRARPEVVLHMAAQALVRASYDEPADTYDVNVMGTVNLLEAVRATPGVRSVVVVTTDKCYENTGDGRAFDEDAPLGGHDPYASSKACAELVCSAYRRSFFAASAGVGLASARAGNVIGGGDAAIDRLIPDLCRAFDRNEPVTLRFPHATRPWQHVMEPLAGYLMLAERLWRDPARWAGGWNFGPDEHDVRDVQAIANRLALLLGAALPRVQPDADAPHEAPWLALDSRKARERLGWQPRWNVDRALASIAAWERARRAGADARATVHEQITQYLQDAAPADGLVTPALEEALP